MNIYFSCHFWKYSFNVSFNLSFSKSNYAQLSEEGVKELRS